MWLIYIIILYITLFQYFLNMNFKHLVVPVLKRLKLKTYSLY